MENISFWFVLSTDVFDYFVATIERRAPILPIGSEISFPLDTDEHSAGDMTFVVSSYSFEANGTIRCHLHGSGEQSVIKFDTTTDRTTNIMTKLGWTIEPA